MTSEADNKPAAVDNTEVARILNQIADMLEFQNENAFKFRAYRMAAETIESMETPVAELVEQGGSAELQKIPGIGKGISSQVAVILQTGHSPYLEELTADIPASVLDLRRISGVGLKTAQALYRDFNVKSLDELRALAEGGGLTSVPGLGEKTIARIKSSLDRLSREK
jgi:DNA polymerase (family 10)